ncbi:MAG: sporulation protein YabP [Clostridia bacterium]|nr:sporulation protein YabP [Clostridia bacterium]
MGIEKDISHNSQNQNITLKNRKDLAITGVEDIDSFDDKIVCAYTNYGKLKIRGENLNIKKVDIKSGILEIEGKISGMIYIDDLKKKNGILGKIFK